MRKSPASSRGLWFACLLVGLIFPVAIVACASSEPVTITDVLVDLTSDYTQPMLEAATPVLCEFIDPSTENPDCAALVATMDDSNHALDLAIYRLGRLAPRWNPKEAESVALLDEAIAALAATDQADELIIDGWKKGDFTTWSEGWTLRDEATDLWIRFVEDLYRFIEASESPSASGQ